MPINTISKTVKDIKQLKIQGAEAVALSSLRVLKEIIHSSRASKPKLLLAELSKARSQLENARPTEPALVNSMKFVFTAVKHTHKPINIHNLKESFLGNLQQSLNHFESSQNIIAEIGSSKIKNSSVIYTHCHSSTVESILLKAKQKHINFEVNNTETRPLFQGRKTAKNLSSNGIPVTHYVDSAARIALKDADMMLIGCDAITTEKVINKIGSELIAEAANKIGVPIYICTDSWKFDFGSVFGKEVPIENRDPKEIWNNPPKKVTICNPAFEKIDINLISGIISELGIYPHNIFLEELRQAHNWIFRI